MSKKLRNIILIIAFLQVMATIGIFALPRAVRALPGEYYVRLQNNPLTSGMMHMITTPIPTALPVAASAPIVNASTTNLQIPGLDEQQPTPFPTPQPLATPAAIAGATPEPTAVPTNIPTPRPTLTPPPASVILEGVPSEVQGFNNCGPANLTIVLDYHGDDTTQEEAAAYLKPNKEDRNVS
ncbi:MAG: hypothetical protein KC415_20640, partial [Anaerolineales bacterium]|nr:hypothetical protein [Anaerolineales bacterium]